MTKVSSFIKFGLILILLFIITGCSTTSSSRNVNFIGESEHWIVSYSLSGTEVDTETEKISYKGSDVKSVGSINYSFDGRPFVKTSGVIDFPPKGYIEFTSANSKGPIPNKDTVIKFKIEWNEQIEYIDLKYTNQQL